jgi:hypothetical protein
VQESRGRRDSVAAGRRSSSQVGLPDNSPLSRT